MTVSYVPFCTGVFYRMKTKNKPSVAGIVDFLLVRVTRNT